MYKGSLLSTLPFTWYNWPSSKMSVFCQSLVLQEISLKNCLYISSVLPDHFLKKYNCSHQCFFSEKSFYNSSQECNTLYKWWLQDPLTCVKSLRKTQHAQPCQKWKTRAASVTSRFLINVTKRGILGWAGQTVNSQWQNSCTVAGCVLGTDLCHGMFKAKSRWFKVTKTPL